MGDLDGSAKAFELFDSLLMLETPLLSHHLADMVGLYIKIASNREYDESIRIMALSFLMWCSVYKKNRLQKLNLTEPLISSLLVIGSEQMAQDDTNLDESDDSAVKLAFQVISSLATNLPPSLVFNEVMRHSFELIRMSTPGCRKSAMLALSVVVDGCADYMRSKLDQILPSLYLGLNDSETMVRRAACIALGSLAGKYAFFNWDLLLVRINRWLKYFRKTDEIEEVGEHHEALMPLLLKLINDSEYSVYCNALSALDAILEGLHDQVFVYLPGLMTRFLQLLESGDRKIRMLVTACIGSAAHASGNDFIPYFNEVIPRLHMLMRLGADKEDLDLRGVATDTVSTIAEAVGKDVFRV